MKVVIETSTLISGSIFWKYDYGNDIYQVKHKHYETCSRLFGILKKLSSFEIGIITKTVENEAKDTLNKAVQKTISTTHFPNLTMKYKIMTLQHIISNECLYELERIVEECSIRPSIDLKERDRIIREELEPYLDEVVKNTVRYLKPSIPKFIRGSLRDELSDIMIGALPSKGVIYKGMPGPRDFVIMAEATMIYRKYDGKEVVYVASKDNHFKPNPVQIDSYLSPKSKFLDELDPTVRDEIANKFGFIGEDPRKVGAELQEKYRSTLCT